MICLCGWLFWCVVLGLMYLLWLRCLLGSGFGCFVFVCFDLFRIFDCGLFALCGSIS